MSETKPEKQLVSKARYIWVMGQKIGTYTLAGTMLLFGVILVMITGLCLIGSILAKGIRMYLWLFAGCAAVCAIAAFVGCAFIFKAAMTIDQVEPITDQNTHLLPLEDTLLRGSDLPPTVQQAELLRATQAGQETPQEQLLRATTGEE